MSKLRTVSARQLLFNTPAATPQLDHFHRRPHTMFPRNVIPKTVERVEVNTAHAVNERIEAEAFEEFMKYRAAHPSRVSTRLDELDREWDIERCLETAAPTFSLIGLALGLTKDRRWLALPAIVQTFLLQHAVQGWCPPLPVLRRLGFRTATEINRERNALKALRGDFAKAKKDVKAAWNAAEA
jgi:hypothetical protein